MGAHEAKQMIQEQEKKLQDSTAVVSSMVGCCTCCGEIGCVAPVLSQTIILGDTLKNQAQNRHKNQVNPRLRENQYQTHRVFWVDAGRLEDTVFFCLSVAFRISLGTEASAKTTWED